MFESYTEKARRIIFFSRRDAGHLCERDIKATHLLLGLLREGKALWLRLKMPEEKLQAIREACSKPGPERKPVPGSVDMPLDQEANSILVRATEEMRSRMHKETDDVHLLLAMLHVPGNAKDILNQQGLTYAQVSALLPFRPPHEASAGDLLDYT